MFFPYVQKTLQTQDELPQQSDHQCFRRMTYDKTTKIIFIVLSLRKLPLGTIKKSPKQLHENYLYFEETYTKKQLLGILRIKEFLKKYNIHELGKTWINTEKYDF